MGSLKSDQGFSEHIVGVVKALAHPVRLRIVAHLCEGDEHVSGLVEKVNVEQAIVSQQLKILRMTGLVRSERVDGFAVYSLAEPRLINLISCLEGCTLNNKGERL